MIAMLLVGLPLYVCATASVPLAAALIAKGISPGAALVFLMTGPATNAAALAAVWKVMGKRTTFIYLGTTAIAALASGVLLDYILTLSVDPELAVPMEAHAMMSIPVKTVFSLALIALLALAFLQACGEKKEAKEKKAAAQQEQATIGDQEMMSVTLTIEGMTCQHCVQTVTRVLSQCDGVSSAEVFLEAGEALVKGTNLDKAALTQAVVDAGGGVYKVTKAE
jgi:copper chaperone CopZ